MGKMDRGRDARLRKGGRFKRALFHRPSFLHQTINFLKAAVNLRFLQKAHFSGLPQSGRVENIQPLPSYGFLNPRDSPPKTTWATAKTIPLVSGATTRASSNPASTMQTMRNRNPAALSFIRGPPLRTQNKAEGWAFPHHCSADSRPEGKFHYSSLIIIHRVGRTHTLTR